MPVTRRAGLRPPTSLPLQDISDICNSSDPAQGITESTSVQPDGCATSQGRGGIGTQRESNQPNSAVKSHTDGIASTEEGIEEARSQQDRYASPTPSSCKEDEDRAAGSFSDSSSSSSEFGTHSGGQSSPDGQHLVMAQLETYQRRRRTIRQITDKLCSPEEVDMPLQLQSCQREQRRLTNHSWMERSLRSRGHGRRSSIAEYRFSLSDLDWQPPVEQIFLKKEVQRNAKRHELPTGFVEAQQRLFAEVDAFELESSEESPACHKNSAVWPSDDEDGDAESPLLQPGTSSVPAEIVHAADVNKDPEGYPEQESQGFFAPYTQNCPNKQSSEGFLQQDLQLKESGLAFTTIQEEEALLSVNVQVDPITIGAEETATSSTTIEDLSIFAALLRECNQEEPVTLAHAIGSFCTVADMVKLGEGTFGEAFGAPGHCFKIVPMAGDILVNGEPQRSVEDTFSEVLITNALKELRNFSGLNACTTFIETKGVFICKGVYDPQLVNLWEDWDAENDSENEHPMIFSERQLYVVYVFDDGGKDLERFVISTFEEARSLLHQVVLGLAVAEQVCNFEHRDLHWGNVLVARNVDTELLRFRLDGRDRFVRAHGINVSIIDFTLSRLDAGNRLLYYDLSADPWIFEGPARDLQSNTYRRMNKLVQGHWEGRFPKTNCLWLHYLADILLNRKSFVAKPQEKRQLSSFRKRVLLYHSAAAALSDEFFDGLWLD